MILKFIFIVLKKKKYDPWTTIVVSNCLVRLIIFKTSFKVIEINGIDKAKENMKTPIILFETNIYVSLFVKNNVFSSAPSKYFSLSKTASFSKIGR